MAVSEEEDEDEDEISGNFSQRLARFKKSPAKKGKGTFEGRNTMF